MRVQSTLLIAIFTRKNAQTPAPLSLLCKAKKMTPLPNRLRNYPKIILPELKEFLLTENFNIFTVSLDHSVFHHLMKRRTVLEQCETRVNKWNTIVTFTD